MNRSPPRLHHLKSFEQLCPRKLSRNELLFGDCSEGRNAFGLKLSFSSRGSVQENSRGALGGDIFRIRLVGNSNKGGTIQNGLP